MYIFRYTELIKHLALREIKARYKQSFFGFIWIVVSPLAQMLIMSFVFGHILRLGNLGVPYPIFVFVGLLPWMLFTNSLNSTISELVSSASLIKKIYFPREVLIISTLLAKIVDFFIAAIIFFILMVIYQIPFTWYMLLFFPILLIQLIFTLGLSLILSAGNLLYRDIQYFFQLIITLWMYLTPIVYSIEFFPEQYRWIFKFNPMAVFVNAYRQVLLGGGMFNVSSLLIALALSTILFVIAYNVFKKLEGVMADIV